MAVIQYRQMNDARRYVNESHPKAKLSDSQVDDIRDMHESDGLSATEIARTLGIPRRTIRCILSYENRAQTPARVVKYVRPS